MQGQYSRVPLSSLGVQRFAAYFIGFKYLNLVYAHIIFTFYALCTLHGPSMLKIYIFSYRIIFHFFHQCHRGVLGPHTSFKAEFATCLKEPPGKENNGYVVNKCNIHSPSGKNGGG
jgi:hypothetical protein